MFSQILLKNLLTVSRFYLSGSIWVTAQYLHEKKRIRIAHYTNCAIYFIIAWVNLMFNVQFYVWYRLMAFQWTMEKLIFFCIWNAYILLTFCFVCFFQFLLNFVMWIHNYILALPTLEPTSRQTTEIWVFCIIMTFHQSQ